MYRYCKQVQAAFPSIREERLRETWRWRGWDFQWRSSLWSHGWRVTGIVNHLLPIAESVFFFDGFDGRKALAGAVIHDDPETKKGCFRDYTVLEKDGMSEAQLAVLKEEELAAIDMLVQEFPAKFMGYTYRELLMNAALKTTLESKLVKWADWLDAYCEALHEFFGGNPSVLTGIIRCLAGMEQLRNSLKELWPLFERGGSPFLNIPQIGIHKHYLPRISRGNYPNRPHTPESVRELETDIPVYNAWKELVIEGFGEEGIEWLTTQVEGIEFDQPTPALTLVAQSA